MICRECNSDMTKDDVDYNFKGNYDVYWGCSTCNTSCIEVIRYGRPIKEIWHSEIDDVKDYVIFK